jgi:hypothetical protein
MGCTDADWLRWLPQAVGELHWSAIGAWSLFHFNHFPIHLHPTTLNVLLGLAPGTTHQKSDAFGQALSNGILIAPTLGLGAADSE